MPITATQRETKDRIIKDLEAVFARTGKPFKSIGSERDRRLWAELGKRLQEDGPTYTSTHRDEVIIPLVRAGLVRCLVGLVIDLIPEIDTSHNAYTVSCVPEIFDNVSQPVVASRRLVLTLTLHTCRIRHGIVQCARCVTYPNFSGATR